MWKWCGNIFVSSILHVFLRLSRLNSESFQFRKCCLTQIRSLFHVQCYSTQVIAMQDVFNKFDKDTTTVQHRSWNVATIRQSYNPVSGNGEWVLRQRLPRKRRVRTPELHDAWRDVCLTRTEVVLWKDESSPRSLRSTFQRRSIWIYVSIFDRQLYWEGITEVFDLPSFQATKSRVSWN